MSKIATVAIEADTAALATIDAVAASMRLPREGALHVVCAAAATDIRGEGSEGGHLPADVAFATAIDRAAARFPATKAEIDAFVATLRFYAQFTTTLPIVPRPCPPTPPAPRGRPPRCRSRRSA